MANVRKYVREGKVGGIDVQEGDMLHRSEMPRLVVGSTYTNGKGQKRRLLHIDRKFGYGILRVLYEPVEPRRRRTQWCPLPKDMEDVADRHDVGEYAKIMDVYSWIRWVGMGSRITPWTVEHPAPASQ